MLKENYSRGSEEVFFCQMSTYSINTVNQMNTLYLLTTVLRLNITKRQCFDQATYKDTCSTVTKNSLQMYTWIQIGIKTQTMTECFLLQSIILLS